MQSTAKYTVVGLLFALYALPAIGHPVHQPEVAKLEIQDEVAEKIRGLVNSINVSVTKEKAASDLKKMFDNELEYIRNLERNLGQTPKLAAKSCNQIAALRPCSEPGYYWVQGTDGVVGVYCEFKTAFAHDQPGGWTRVANVNMTRDSECPEGLEMLTQPRRMCRKTLPSGGCSSATFSTYGQEYKKVCGKVLGYQYYTTDAFDPYYKNRQLTVDNLYVDGVSITHGCSPRHHIWTFAAALHEDGRSSYRRYTCPCSNTQSSFNGAIPPFVGTDYFCETGNRVFYQNNAGKYLVDDPLWDGKGCGPASTCCDGAGKPWFCKDLPQPTTDDIEVRLCADTPRGSNEDVAIEIIELYIQ